MRGVEHLTTETRALAEKLVLRCAESGLKIKITDTLRTKAEQDELYAQGRTKAGRIVTNAKYPYSMHNWGVAFDFCRNDGLGAYNDSDGFFERVGVIAEGLGLEWGGRWKSIVDKPHVQLSKYGSTPQKLIQQFKNPDVFMNNSRKQTLKIQTARRGSRGACVKIIQLFLGITDDGIFGSDTQQAVMNFQAQHGLVVDGIVGGATWQAMLNSMMETK